MRNLKLLFILLGAFISFISEAQERKQVSIKRAEGQILLDGILDEDTWQNADIADDFQQNFPTDGINSEAISELRFTYDDKFIYVGAKLYNTGETDYVTPSLRRDFRGGGNDMLIVQFDTFDDKTNAFQFGVNPFGVRREGLIANGGGNGGDLSLDWENKWQAKVTQHDGYWMVEMAIPFKSIRYKEGTKIWNINSYRIDSRTGERSTWNAIPRNFRLYSLAHTGQLIWDKPLGSPGANVSIIPYISGNSAGDGGYIPTGEIAELPRTSESSGNFGFDAKLGIGAALNLDLTVNPDFSQVEVDRQVTNLDRFEIFFPERRQFFLENADLFSQFGQDGLRPFFSRRIGVSIDASTGQNIQNKINAGARLSGKLNNNWRIGVLSMQADEERDINLPQINYTVAALQRKIFNRSNIGLILINKQDFRNESGTNFNQYNRVAGIDYNLASSDNVWNGKLFYHRSFDKDSLNNTEGRYATAASLNYSTVEWNVQGTLQKVGDNYNPEVGFARRSGYDFANLEVQKNFYPQNGPFQQFNPRVAYQTFQNDSLGTTDTEITIGINSQLKNTGRFEASLSRSFIYLFRDFDPTREGNLALPEGSDYTFINLEASYNSDTRQLFFYTLRSTAGEYFNGSRYSLGGNINYRFQPYGLVSLDFNYNNIRLPDPYGDADIFLIGPRFDITFNKSLFWTTFIQYNSQIDNINVNSRLQWRFKPVSDIFIAYTDNYFPGDFVNKNRALVIKMTYWLNL